MSHRGIEGSGQLKILLYNHFFFPSVGGTEVSGRMMARELTRLGHEVTVVTHTHLPFGKPELTEGYRIVRDRRLRVLHRLASECDVLVSRGGVSLRVVVASIFGQVPFVAFHEDAAQATGGVRHRLRSFFKAIASNRAMLHVLVSDALIEMVSLPTNSARFRLYNPVQEELWTPLTSGFSDRDLDVVFVGRLVSSKGLEVLRNALRSIAHHRPLRVCIAGGGSDLTVWRESFQNLVAEVEFVGAVEGERLRELYARARIVVVPSLSREGMGMVAAEALANGVPVCASDQPALREVIGDAGLFHRVGDASGLARDITILLTDKKSWQSLSNAARARRSRYSMKQYRENLLRLLREISARVSG